MSKRRNKKGKGKRSRSSVALANVRKFFPAVTSVTDADENAYLDVTGADVKQSSKKDHNKCAMAVAAKREFKASGVVISASMAYVVKHNKAIRFQLPQSVQKEVVSFDRGSGFDEGKYELKAPAKSARIGARQERAFSPSRTHDNTNKRRFYHATTGIRAVLGGKKRD